MHDISDSEAKKEGIITCHHQMDNGEKRFRLTRTSGSSYILTLSSDIPAWQNSHIHYHKTEFYLVEKGWILIALLKEDTLEIKQLNAEESMMIPKGIPHNVYLAKDSILHAIKYGSAKEDWNACPKLDQMLHEKEDILLVNINV